MSEPEQAAADALVRLGAFARDIPVPPYEQIERLRARRTRRNALGGAVVVLAAATAAIFVTPALGRQSTPNAAAGRAVVTVTVTVPAAVVGPLGLRDISFSTDADGAALGQRCDTQGRCDTVVRTTSDGGATFGGDRVVTRASGAGPTKIAAVAGTPVVYAYDPGLYLSRDGGRSWRDVSPLGMTVPDVAVRGGALTVLAMPTTGAARLLTGRVSDASGRLGSPTTVPDSTTAARLQQPADGTDVVTSLTRTGSRIVEVRPAASGRWVSRALPAGCTSPSLATSGTLSWWLVCAAAGSAGSVVASPVAYGSSDGGLTWRQLGPVIDPAIRTVTALSPTNAYLSGPGGSLLVTNNGGASWMTTLPAAAAGYGEPHILDTTVGSTWVVSGSVVWRVDASAQWRATRLS